MRIFVALALAVGAAACAPPPPLVVAPPPPPRPTLSFEQKQGLILKFENQRLLRNPPADSPVPVVSEGAPPTIDEVLAQTTLIDLLTDGEARVRRRAAMALGRAGLADAVPALVARLADEEPEVRQMAAFALGLVHDGRAREPLMVALNDPVPIVQASAAEALGLLGDASAASAIATMATRILESGGLTPPPADGRDDKRDTPADAFRLALTALARLKAFPALAAVTLDTAGQPKLTWWPVAFALGRLEDPRAASALLTLAADPQLYTRAFAIKGLGALKEQRAVPLLLPLVSGPDRTLAIEAIRALGRIGDPRASAVLVKAIQSSASDPSMRIEATTAIGNVGGDGVNDLLLDLIADRNPLVRGAAIRSFGHLSPEAFVAILSGLDADPHWAARAALATALGDLPDSVGVARLKTMLNDEDQRVIPAVLSALAHARPADVAPILLAQLKAVDPVVRAAAAAAIGEIKLSQGPAALREAYQFGESDVTYLARGAAIAAMAAYGKAEAVPLLTQALSDPEWAVRVRALELLRGLDAEGDAAAAIRPAPMAHGIERYDLPRLITPPVSTAAYLDTDQGTIQIELAVLDAPLTVENFVALARSGFYEGITFHRVVPNFVVQAGDPRGDGEGGPGFTIRDELNQRSYGRGTVGMALDWADTGGSQFFITHSPQPHLDARYTVFGRVVEGMDVVDRLQPGDVLRHVRIWDGVER